MSSEEGFDNRRKELREERSERLFLQLALPGARSANGRTTLYAATENVSAAGLRVRCDSALEPGSAVECWVRVKGCPGTFLLHARVRWLTPAADGQGHCVGLELLEDPRTDHARWVGLFRQGPARAAGLP